MGGVTWHTHKNMRVVARPKGGCSVNVSVYMLTCCFLLVSEHPEKVAVAPPSPQPAQLLSWSVIHCWPSGLFHWHQALCCLHYRYHREPRGLKLGHAGMANEKAETLQTWHRLSARPADSMCHCLVPPAFYFHHPDPERGSLCETVWLGLLQSVPPRTRWRMISSCLLQMAQ